MINVEIVLLGFLCGIFVGLMGTGGGFVLVPLLVYLLHMDQHAAQGTSLLVLLPPLGAGAFYLYWKENRVDLAAGLLCALGMLIGGYAGGIVAVGINSRDLKGFFGGFLVVSAALLWRKTNNAHTTAGGSTGTHG